MAEKGLKSAYELAMEKLREQDRRKGISEERGLDDDQKTRIGEVRARCKAKLAEMEILWTSRRRALMADPEALAKAEQEYVAERRRAEKRAESEIEKIRRGSEAAPRSKSRKR